MDALRLIKTARHALSEARTVPDVLLEAWQASRLAEAVGSRIADRETGELGALGRLLSDAGSHAAGCLDQPPDLSDTVGGPGGAGEVGGWSAADWTGGGRADRLDDLGELEPVLDELGRLLHEVAETLVVLACGADAEGLYWRCIDGVDSGAECKDLVAELLRTVRRANGTGRAAGSPGAGCPGAGAGEGRAGRAGRAAAAHASRRPGGGCAEGDPAVERCGTSTGPCDGIGDRRVSSVPPLLVRLGPPAAPTVSAAATGPGALAPGNRPCQR